MDASSAPRVYPWTALGFTVGGAAATAIALAAWGRRGDDAVPVPELVAICGTTILFGVIIGLVVGQFIRVAGIVNAWRPSVETLLGAPAPSTNGHGDAQGRPVQARNGAVLAVVSALGGIFSAVGAIPLAPAPLVLAVGALALDERSWVRMLAALGMFVAAFGLGAFLVSSLVQGTAGGPVFLALIVAIGAGEFLVVRRVRPHR